MDQLPCVITAIESSPKPITQVTIISTLFLEESWNLPQELVLECTNTTLVAELLKKIQLSRTDYRLFSSGKMLLPEDKTLEACGVQDKERLYWNYVQTFPLQVRLGTSGSEHLIQVAECDTITKIRGQLSSELAVTGQVSLHCNGKRLTDDSKTLNECNIRESHVLYVIPTRRNLNEIIQINLHANGTVMKLKLPLSTTVSALHQQYLAESCYANWRLTNEDQILDPTRTLHEYSAVEEENFYAFPDATEGTIIFITSHFPGLVTTQPRLIAATCTIGELAGICSHYGRSYTCPEYAIAHKGKPDECGTRSETIFDEKSAALKLKDLKVLENQGECFHFLPTPASNTGCEELFFVLKGAPQFKLSVPVDLRSDTILAIKKKLKSSSRHNSSLRSILEQVSYSNMKLLYRGKELDHLSTLHQFEFLDGAQLDLVLPEATIAPLIRTAVLELCPAVPLDQSKLPPEEAQYEEVRRTYVNNRKALEKPKESVETAVATIRAATFDADPVRNADLKLVGELLTRAFDDAGTHIALTNTKESNIRMLNHRPESDVVNFNISFNEEKGKTFEDIKNNPALAKNMEMDIRKFVSAKLGIPLDAVVITTITAGTVHFDVIIPASLIIKHSAQIITFQKQIFDAKQQLAVAFLQAFPTFVGTDAMLVQLRDNFNFSMGDFDARGDFRFPSQTGAQQKRGGLDYHQPNSKWRRLGLRVLGLYLNDDWIKMDGNAQEWAVGFHGPNGKVDAFKGVGLSRMVCLANANAWGGKVSAPGTTNAGKPIPATGIYFSQDVDTCYKTGFPINGKNYEIAFQCRVHPDHIYLTGNASKWFVVDDPTYVRPYGILLKEI